MINANDWNKIVNAKLSFLRWFGLITDAYIHRYAYGWDRELHVQLELKVVVLWAQLSIL